MEVVRGVPELVIEIGSPSTRRRDETIKRRLYERAGVDEYWIVDPEIDVVRVYRRDGDRFGRPIELSADAGDVLARPSCQASTFRSRESSPSSRRRRRLGSSTVAGPRGLVPSAPEPVKVAPMLRRQEAALGDPQDQRFVAPGRTAHHARPT
jgi:hypothetical protein